MRKTFCDKCGKEITTDVEWVFNHELCSKCAEAVDIFITHPSGPSTVDVQTVKNGCWITKAEDYYKTWQDSGRSWDDMPYFVTGVKFACSNCFGQFDIDAKGVEKWNGCPLCLARMDGDAK